MGRQRSKVWVTAVLMLAFASAAVVAVVQSQGSARLAEDHSEKQLTEMKSSTGEEIRLLILEKRVGYSGLFATHRKSRHFRTLVERRRRIQTLTSPQNVIEATTSIRKRGGKSEGCGSDSSTKGKAGKNNKKRISTKSKGNIYGRDCDLNLMDVARADPTLSTVVALFQVAGFEKIFERAGPFTLLLPRNAAFDEIGGDTIAALIDPANLDILQDVLLYHVLPGLYPTRDLRAGALETLLAEAFATVSLNPLMFDNAGVDTADITARNGIVHIIDGVLVPDAPSSPTDVPGFPTNPPSTAVAPSEFPNLSPTPQFGSPTILPHGMPSLLPSTAIVATPSASPTRAPDSIIPTLSPIVPHGMPSLRPTTAPTPSSELSCADFVFVSGGAPNCSPNILDEAKSNPKLSIVVSLFEVAGIQNIFSCPGPFTALFPTNEAFMNLKPGRLDFLMQPENLELLQAILLYHVLPGQKATSDLQAGPTDTLLDGKTVLVGLDPLKFDNSVVRRKDIPSCNGLFNVLDTVLDPFTASPTIAPMIAVGTKSPSAAPVVASTASPTESITRVAIDRFFIAYVSESTVEPTAAEYEQLRAATVMYYETFLSTAFSSNPLVKFVGVEFTLDFTMHAAGIPEARFNIYMEYSGAVVSFEPAKSNPDKDVIFLRLKKGITPDYLLDTVRALKGTPFGQVNEGNMNSTIL